MEESGGKSLQAWSADADVRPEISGEPQHEVELAGETSERAQESEPTGMSEPDTGSRDEAQKAHGVDEHE
jgi:hypothetical protein